MSLNGRAHRRIHDPGFVESPARDGVCAAGTSPLAMAIALNGEPVVETIHDDADTFDTDRCSIYFHCDDCGSDSFRHNRCAGCGAAVPWVAKLGCGLA